MILRETTSDCGSKETIKVTLCCLSQEIEKGDKTIKKKGVPTRMWPLSWRMWPAQWRFNRPSWWKTWIDYQGLKTPLRPKTRVENGDFCDNNLGKGLNSPVLLIGSFSLWLSSLVQCANVDRTLRGKVIANKLPVCCWSCIGRILRLICSDERNFREIYKLCIFKKYILKESFYANHLQTLIKTFGLSIPTSTTAMLK